MVVPNTSQSKQPRDSRSFPHRLAAYSVAAGATLIAADQAQAEIVYHNPGPQFAFDTTLPLNMNPPADALGDGIVDLNLEHIDFGGGFTFNAAVEGQGNTAVAESGIYSPKLSENDPIDGSLTFTTFSKVLGFRDYYYGSAFGPWPGAGPGFLAVRLDISGNSHYGWARLSVDDFSGTIGLFDWAYESDPDTQILAGAVPEPNALALMALGAAGIVGWRMSRRKKNAAEEN